MKWCLSLLLVGEPRHSPNLPEPVSHLHSAPGLFQRCQCSACHSGLVHLLPSFWSSADLERRWLFTFCLPPVWGWNWSKWCYHQIFSTCCSGSWCLGPPHPLTKTLRVQGPSHWHGLRKAVGSRVGAQRLQPLYFFFSNLYAFYLGKSNFAPWGKTIYSRPFS